MVSSAGFACLALRVPKASDSQRVFWHRADMRGQPHDVPCWGQSTSRYDASGFSLGKLVSRHRRACTANQPIRLFKNVGIFRLFSGEEAEHHEGCAK